MQRSELLYRTVTAAGNRRSLWISYVNGWTLVRSQRSTTLQRLLNSTGICYADGLGVGVASMLLSGKWVRKVTANDFIFDLCKELADRNLTIALIGARGEVIHAASDIISKAVPHLHIVVQSSGYFSPAEEENLKTDLLKSEPNVVLVGMGQPRQEEWVAQIKPLLPGTVFCCVGGLFDYLARPREWADFARRLGLEWAYKFCRSPKSMAPRYLFGIPALFGYILAEQAANVWEVVCRWTKSLRHGGNGARRDPSSQPF